ncbi:MAG: gamma-glutamyltransferase [Phycisphaerales bacterium]|nr:gamma-glutamyltransferase [Phycisphaerales bacterium]
MIATAGAAAAAGVAASGVRAQPTDGAFDYGFPYSSQRMPVLARNCVATSQPLAAQAGLEMLRKGGNAIDAAVATAAALTVVEPCSNGIGSDNFALIWTKGKLHGLNASGRAPRALKRERYDGMDSIPLYGWDAVTTPGAVSGWAAALEDHGTLPMTTVLEPAIRYAREGYLVSPQVGQSWELSARRYQGDAEFDAWQQTFCPNGRAPRIGELWRSEDHARTLEQIAQTKGAAFYQGELAERIDAEARKFGGELRQEDLAAHAPDWVEPIAIDYHGVRLHEIPPNGQGIAALMMLGILRHFDMASLPPDSVESLHLQIEAMKLAFRDAHRYVADPAYMDRSVESLLDADYLKSRAALIDRSKAIDFKHGAPKEGGTVLLTTADAQGNMVSWIQSNYTGFGSGMVIPGTGIALHNRGGCFNLEPGHPNEIGPNKRPYHTIIPGFVTRNDEPLMTFGVMGGYMQPQGHAQVMTRLVDAKQNPQAALDAPRWQITEGLHVDFEPGFESATYDALRAMGHDLAVQSTRNAYFGRGQAIYKLQDGYLAASDLRADGQAVGY